MSLKTTLRDILAISTVVVGATTVVNGALAGLYAAQEGIERLFGAETREHVATFKPGSTKKIALPAAHGQITQGTFTLENGVDVAVLDAPVVTAGKYWPGMKNLVEGQTYKVTLFESGFYGPRFVKADKL